MKKNIKKIVSHPLISGSSIIFIGSFIANLFNYLFNLLIGRLLSPAEFGLVVSLSSLFTLFALFQSFFSNVFARFTAIYFARKDESGIRMTSQLGLKIVVVTGILLFILLLASNEYIMSFLHISNFWFLTLIYGAILFTVISSLSFGVFQGQMRFFLLSIMNNIMSITKLCLGVGLILLGFGALGAVSGIFLSGFISSTIFTIYLFYSLRKTKDKKAKLNTKNLRDEMILYAKGFFPALVGITILSNTDIIFVRHFFDPTISGQYAALSLMGKVIFYFTSPIGFVLFPLIAYKHEKKEPLIGTVILACGIVAVASMIPVIFYTFDPHLVLLIFFPAKQYQILIPYLGMFSVYSLLFSLGFLLNNFFLAVGKTAIYKITIFSSVVQIVLILLFHQTLMQIILILLSVATGMFCLFCLYYFILYKRVELR